MKIGIAVILVLAIVPDSISQEKDSVDIMMGVVEDGDSVIYMDVEEIVVIPPKEFKNARQERRYNRYVKRVKKVYPYAKMAGEMLDEYEPKYQALDNDRERRKMMKELEQQLLDEYKDDLKRMSLTEGRILLKLIDRETSRTSYSLIKDFRGGVPAVFWQGIARLFGSNLKAEYDPEGDDRVLEEIVSLIEIGYL